VAALRYGRGVGDAAGLPEVTIPFNHPSIEGKELSYLEAAVRGGHSAAKGPFSEEVVTLLRDELDAADVLLTTSCTSALELSAMLLDLQPGDTVIVPSFTFVTTALAFAREGARLVFADIEPETLGIDPQSVAERLDDTVRAVVPVHYAGVGCDLAGLAPVLDACAGRGQVVDMIEDNAHGLFGRVDGKPLGSFGRMSTLSFHETKNFTCGEGGALVLNRAADVERAHVLYDKGTNRRAFQHGQVDKYSWVDRGSSFGMADILAAYLLAQLEARDSILAKRRAVYECYRRLLEPEAEALGFRLPVVPPGHDQAYHMFYVLLADGATRDRALAGLRRAGILATFHYVPLHSSAMGRKLSTDGPDCPVTDDISRRLLRLPFYNDLPTRDIEQVVTVLLETLQA
jgi:dTDP-4-amino-4,6-dideoxygalactose transaminase